MTRPYVVEDEQEKEEVYYGEDVDPLIGMTFNFMPSSKPAPDDAPRGGQGSQVLPVADYLEDDFAGDPEDGLEYLYLVRREAEQQPRVSRASNLPEAAPSDAMAVDASDSAEDLDRPTEQWRQTFLAQFTALRTRLIAAPPSSEFPPPSHNPTPKAKDLQSWHTFINGLALPSPPSTVLTTTTTTPHPAMTELEAARAQALASLDEPDSLPPPSSTFHSGKTTMRAYDPDYLPHLPTPQLMLEFSSPLALSILSLLSQWTVDPSLCSSDSDDDSDDFLPKSSAANGGVGEEEEERPTMHEIQWVLSLLLRVDSLLEGADIGRLRDLVRALMGGTSGEKAGKEDEGGQERKAAVWMVRCVVAGVWGQKDLWDDRV